MNPTIGPGTQISNSIPELYAEIQETLQIVIQAALGNPDSQESLSSENNSPGGLPISVNEGVSTMLMFLKGFAVFLCEVVTNVQILCLFEQYVWSY